MMRKDERHRKTVEISDEIRQVVQFPMHHSRHLAPSSAYTKYHKSKDVVRNSIFGVQETSKECGHCDRLCKEDVNLLLHIYWHAYRKDNAITARTSRASDEDEMDVDDDDISDEEESIVKYNFAPSPGWLQRFQERYDIKSLKLKGKKNWKKNIFGQKKILSHTHTCKL